MSNFRIGIADDHPMILDGLEAMINRSSDLQLVVRASNGRELLAGMNQHQLDVVLLDIDMPQMNGIETTAAIREQHPSTRILILTMHDEKNFIQQLINDGANGYLLKNCSEQELLLAIRNVCEGKSHFSGEVTMKLMEPEHHAIDELKELTQREIEILTQVAQGKSNKEIGDTLFISHRTVDTHRTNLMKKLDVNNIAGLVRIAYRNKLVE